MDWVVFAFVPWSAKRNRGHHLARELVARGGRVLWIDPPPTPSSEGVEEVAQGIWHAGGPGKLARSLLGQQRWVRSFRPLLRRWRNAEVPLGGLVQCPWLATAALSLRWDHLVYDALDDWRYLPPSAPKVEAAEKHLAARADLVLAVSEPIRERFALLGARTELLRNACRPEDWSAAATPPAEVSDLQAPRFLYAGGLEAGFDTASLAAAARALPDASWILVGPCAHEPTRRALEAIPRTHLLGKRPYAELSGMLAGADACLLPFRDTPFNQARDSLKLYEYLAAGRPVAASALPAAQRFAPWIELARPGDPGAFAAACRRALENDSPQLRLERRAAVATHTWAARAARLDSLLSLSQPSGR